MLREVRTANRVETIQDWGPPESFRREFRRLRASSRCRASWPCSTTSCSAPTCSACCAPQVTVISWVAPTCTRTDAVRRRPRRRDEFDGVAIVEALRAGGELGPRGRSASTRTSTSTPPPLRGGGGVRPDRAALADGARGPRAARAARPLTDRGQESASRPFVLSHYEEHMAVTRSPVKARRRVIVRFAGDSGDGMQLAGSRFTEATAEHGNDFATLTELPGRDPRSRRHARRRVRLPDPLRVAGRPHAGRRAGRAGGDEPGGAAQRAPALAPPAR